MSVSHENELPSTSSPPPVNMVERVAMAIFNASVKNAGREILWTDEDASWPAGHVRDEARQCARAAIAAMREPTVAMCEACEASVDLAITRAETRRAWRSAIDAALSAEALP